MNTQAFHTMSYGMYLVASEYKGEKTGYVANTVFQVTSKPPMLAISCHKENFSADIIRKSGAFSVSVLNKEVDVTLIGDFGFMSGRELDKFTGRKLTVGQTGAPVVLDGAIAWFDCKVREEHDLGTHWLILGEVVDAEFLSEEEPLTYRWYREKYKMFSPKHSPTFQDPVEPREEGRQTTGLDIPEPAKATGDSPRVCVICGFVYDPEKGDPTLGIPPGTTFDELPEDYRCPICNATKEYFKEV